MVKKLWLFTILIAVTLFYFSRDFNSRYERIITGDAKGYYAYLPAIFIYHDSEYKFLNEMEMKYYPEDGSHFKNFKNKQKNGEFVNKCFPGLPFLYLPFFTLSAIYAWLAGIPVDGYSMPFQVGIGIAHLFYLFSGFYLLFQFIKKLNLSPLLTFLISTSLVFGTNILFYITYDFTVSHIFNFFLASLFIWSHYKLIESKKTKWIGLIGVLISFIIIVRPTNAMMLLFTPFIFKLLNENFIDFIKTNFKWKEIIAYIPIALFILFIPLALWKWQSDLWFVYSYNEEGFNFKSPNWFNFLFSFKKGWLLWSPILFIFLLITSIHLFKKSSYFGLTFITPFIIIIYVLSSWWCWTYGMGMGQRVMIDFYPFILIGTISAFQNTKYIKVLIFVCIAFISLNIIQAYQIRHDILRGGRTTKKEYVEQFLQLKTIAPEVKIDKNWLLISSQKNVSVQKTDSINPFSKAIISKPLDSVKIIVVDIVIGGKHGDTKTSLIVSNEDGNFYESFIFCDFLYEKPRKMSFSIKTPLRRNQVYKTYVWNNNTNEQSEIRNMSVKYFK